MKTHTFVIEVADKVFNRSARDAQRALEFRLDGWAVEKLVIKRVAPDHKVVSVPETEDVSRTRSLAHLASSHKHVSKEDRDYVSESCRLMVAMIAEGLGCRPDASLQEISEIVRDLRARCKDKCTDCDGTGHLVGWPHTTCSTCKGSGVKP